MKILKNQDKGRPPLSRNSMITGALAVFVILAAAGMIYKAFFPGAGGAPAGGSQLSPAATSTVPAAPAPTRVTLVIKGSGRSRTLVVHWNDLPQGTDALNVFRGKTGTPSEHWSLWKTISIAPGMRAEGTSSIALGNIALGGYSFYVQAVGTGNGNATGTGASTSGTAGGQTVMWTSGITEPSLATSTAPIHGTQTQGGPASGTATATSTSSTTTTSSITASTTTSSATTSVSGASSGTVPSGGTSYPYGIPYYNPQAQITAYGTTSVNFSVQHVNQSIQMEWRDLPTSTNLIVISRSPSSSGPWNQLLTQNNPGTTGSYSLSLVDGTLNDPYYYLLVASHDSSTLAAYGPVYLPPQQ